MKELIKHLWHTNRKEIIERTIFNCHCEGLHSIMLLESPGKTIRLYISDQESNMHLNFNPSQMPIGYHAHHCDLTLHCVHGSIYNIKVVRDDSGIVMGRYNYQSAIRTEMKIVEAGIGSIRIDDVSKIREGESVFMKAAEIHTVAVLRGELAAWLVYEGQEDLEYTPIIYSNANPDEIDKELLYQRHPQPYAEDVIFRQLSKIGLL